MPKKRTRKNKKMKVSVVIPTKNEAPMVGEIIDKCRPYADEMLVVDGHSKDKTRVIAKKKGVRVVLDNGKGKGDGLRTAIKEVTGDIIVFIDADFSHDPNDIPKLIKPIVEGKADLVIGSRGIGGSDELYGDFEKFLRSVGSDIITLSINYRFNVRLTDSQNGFRAILTKVVRNLPLKENNFAIEQEMVMKTLRKGYRIVEVSAHEYARRSGDSKIKLRKVWFRHVYTWLKYLIMD